MEGTNHILNLLINGCDLAKKLEYDLYNNNLFIAAPSSSDHNPMVVSKRCDEIIRMFSMAKEQLDSMQPLPLDHYHQQQDMAVEVGFEEQQGKGKGKEVTLSERDEKQHEKMEIRMSPSLLGQTKNPRRSPRYDDQGTSRRVKVPAPQIGNTELPPEDGFTWRKYGQKEILNARFPRSYYRCTHQKLYSCPAKKQVQRLDEDPNTFQILYRGTHTCHMSNTAPSITPPPSSQTVQFIPHQPLTTLPSSYHVDWLSMDFTAPPSEVACTISHHQHQLYSASSNSSILSNNAEAAPSTVRSHAGRDQTIDLLNNQPLLDWTDVFNTGSSGSNSIELIFPSTTTEDIKWENKDMRD